MPVSVMVHATIVSSESIVAETVTCLFVCSSSCDAGIESVVFGA